MIRRFTDLTGKVFGLNTVICFDHINRLRAAMWKVRCKCGNYSIVKGGSLVSGHTESCGCLKLISVTKHGFSSSHKAASEYYCWQAMRQRCNNKNSKDYPSYGGRGIKVYPPWNRSNGFINFIKYMGKKPGKEYSLDRIDNNGNYEPGNVRWATSSQQAYNRRSKKKK